MLDAVLIYFDGGARGNPGPAAIGAVVLDPSSAPPQRLAAVSERIGETTNNVAEYRALDRGARSGRGDAGTRCPRARRLQAGDRAVSPGAGR